MSVRRTSSSFIAPSVNANRKTLDKLESAKLARLFTSSRDLVDERIKNEEG